jgi:hypothetical protein
MATQNHLTSPVTVAVAEHGAAFPASSVAVNVTVVTPTPQKSVPSPRSKKMLGDAVTMSVETAPDLNDQWSPFATP